MADINYGGSTGYGRAYRNRLRGSWGIVDVDDCCNAARHLAKQVDDCFHLCLPVRPRCVLSVAEGSIAA